MGEEGEKNEEEQEKRPFGEVVRDAYDAVLKKAPHVQAIEAITGQRFNEACLDRMVANYDLAKIRINGAEGNESPERRIEEASSIITMTKAIMRILADGAKGMSRVGDENRQTDLDDKAVVDKVVNGVARKGRNGDSVRPVENRRW